MHVRRRRRPIEILFNLEHPEGLEVVTEVNEDANGNGDDDRIADETDSTDDDLQNFRKECQEAGFDVDLGIHLKNSIVF